MPNMKKLTSRESVAINLMKAIAVLSVITAHVVPVSNANRISELLSSFWNVFGTVGVIIFFAIGGFLYNRYPGDGIVFWKKKFHRLILPWLVCSAGTYVLSVVLGEELGAVNYLKWIFGSGTWYYYFTVYLLFLFVFKWLYDREWILYLLMVVQLLALALATFGMTTTLPVPFLTDYLNPLHWVGYFSLGILIRKHRLDQKLRDRRSVVPVACILGAVSLYILCSQGIFTYFHLVSAVFCLSALVMIAAIAYAAADTGISKYVEKIGTYSYCIYLLHMQIVQSVIERIPNCVAKILFSPFIGLGIMLILIWIGLYVCKKLPFGEKLKALVGL